MESTMFCYQCEQTARGTGCTAISVCGKNPEVAALQDLLVYELEGLAFYANEIIKRGEALGPEVHVFVIEGLFATLTNVNFDPERFVDYLRQAQQLKESLRARAGVVSAPAAATYVLPATPEAIQADAFAVDIRPQADTDPDVQSLKDTLLYGLKGMAAYAHHAWLLGFRDQGVNNWLYKGLSAMLDQGVGLAELVGLAMEFGQVNLRCLELLDQANTSTFGHPEPTRVAITHKKGPFIVVSGHDLRDLQQLLEQTEGTGVQVYTHGEMLPAHAYPELKKHGHLAGNYGGAWQLQQREFDQIPGAVLMTTNCLIEPRESYGDRIWTTAAVGWPGLPHITERNGRKDFAPLIKKALELGGWTEDEREQTILVGFGHQALLSNAGPIIEAVKSGQIKHFFLIGGCDGTRPGRNYYTEFAQATPADSLMMTLACGKYRFNKQEYGTVAGFPRLLDVGQCNDAYSAIKVAVALAEAFGCGVNDLPLTLVLSWFEQKAVCILLTLLSLGIKNIYLGPSLPAFISPNVLALLVEQFAIHPISTVEADMVAMLA